MNFKTAFDIFEHTLSKEERVSTAINLGMLAMVDQDLIERASLEVSNALAMGQRVWLTSDLHLGHANIIGYCDRPHFDVGSMNEALLQLLAKVGADELLVIVGDVAFGPPEASLEWVRRIPGRKILITGNHDLTRDGQCLAHLHDGLFEAIVPFLFWSGSQGRDVIACHYPVTLPASYKSPYRLLNNHGHLHEKTVASTDQVKYMNVGWDVDYSLKCL